MARRRVTSEITPPRAHVSAGACNKLQEQDIKKVFNEVRDIASVQHHWYSASDWCALLLRHSPSTFLDREAQLVPERLVRLLNKQCAVGQYETNSHGLYANRYGLQKTYFLPGHRARRTVHLSANARAL